MTIVAGLLCSDQATGCRPRRNGNSPVAPVRSPVGTTVRAWTWTITMPAPCRTPWAAGPRWSEVSSRTTWACSTCWATTWNGATRSFATQRNPSCAVQRPCPPRQQNVRDQRLRTLRGATLVHPPETIRAAFVDAYPPAASVYGTSLRVSRTCSPPSDDKQSIEVRNDQRRPLRGAAAVSVSAHLRAAYVAPQKTNFPLFGWGIRTARTMT